MFKIISKKKLAIITVFFVMMSMIMWTPFGMSTAYALDAPSSGGTGSASDPYKISTKEDLIWIRDQVNSGATFTGEFFKQENDIYLTSDGTSSGTPIDWTSIGWSKQGGVGNGYSPFSGTYDGGGIILIN